MLNTPQFNVFHLKCSLSEIRGTSRGLLRTSFIGCQLHDITLPTTRAEKMVWLNRHGKQVINNSTHKYVYGENTKHYVSLHTIVYNKSINSCRISSIEQLVPLIRKLSDGHGGATGISFDCPIQ